MLQGNHNIHISRDVMGTTKKRPDGGQAAHWMGK